jgi:DNA polymerase III sliding clamp (beta) subunit (PCNA family)
MKIVCHREGMLSACQVTSAAVASRDVKPILKSLKAQAGPTRRQRLRKKTLVLTFISAMVAMVLATFYG